MGRVALAILCFFLGSSICAAEDIFIAQNAAGTDSGANCSNAHSVAWFNTAAFWGAGAALISPGDTVHLCGTITSSLTFQTGGSAGNPITLLFETNAIMSVGCCWAPAIKNSVTTRDFLIIDGGTNGIIENTNNGTSLGFQQGSAAVNLQDCDNCIIRNLNIRDLYVRTKGTADSNTFGIGVIMDDGSNITVHDIVCDDMSMCMTHNYKAAVNFEAFNITATAVTFGVRVASFQANSTMDNVLIHNVEVSGMDKWCVGQASIHCDSIQIFDIQNSGSSLTNAKIFNNFLHGDVGTSTTAFISLTCESCWAYNNITSTAGFGTTPTNGHYFLKTARTATRIANNTIIGNGNTQGQGISAQQNSGVQIENNIFKDIRTAIDCVTSDTTVVSNWNDFFNISATAAFRQCGGGGLIPLNPNWRNTGRDLNSIEGDPLLDANFRLQPGSAAIDAGTDLSALFTTDKDGVTRPQGAAWDIGAFEFVSGPRPNPATNLIITVR